MSTSGHMAASIAQEAARIVAGDRNAQHGDKERSFVAIAGLWNAYLAARKVGPEAPVTPVDVTNMMVLLKLARSVQGDSAHRDHYVDAVGYAAISGELALGAAEADRLADELERWTMPERGGGAVLQG